MRHTRGFHVGPHGVAVFWSAGASERFATRLGQHFAAVELLLVPVPRGEPDALYIARYG